MDRERVPIHETKKLSFTQGQKVFTHTRVDKVVPHTQGFPPTHTNIRTEKCSHTLGQKKCSTHTQGQKVFKNISAEKVFHTKGKTKCSHTQGKKKRSHRHNPSVKL
jgi:hypothetical protein